MGRKLGFNSCARCPLRAAPMPFDGVYHANPVFCVLHYYHCPIYERACDGNRIPMVPKRPRRRHELRLHIVPAMRRRGILLPESTLHRAEFNNIATAETSGALTTISAAQKRSPVKFQRAVCGQELPAATRARCALRG